MPGELVFMAVFWTYADRSSGLPSQESKNRQRWSPQGRKTMLV
jgi:hypothetical protein